MRLPEGLMREHNFREWCMIHLITKFNLLDDGTVKPAPDPIDVVLTINGKEVDFLAVLDELERQHEQLVKDEAKELLEKELSKIIAPLKDSFSELKTQFDGKCREMFPDFMPEEEEDY